MNIISYGYIVRQYIGESSLIIIYTVYTEVVFVFIALPTTRDFDKEE